MRALARPWGRNLFRRDIAVWAKAFRASWAPRERLEYVGQPCPWVGLDGSPRTAVPRLPPQA
eukprot:4402026-Pyramimonas_sp.AAC.1